MLLTHSPRASVAGPLIVAVWMLFHPVASATCRIDLFDDSTRQDVAAAFDNPQFVELARQLGFRNLGQSTWNPDTSRYDYTCGKDDFKALKAFYELSQLDPMGDGALKLPRTGTFVSMTTTSASPTGAPRSETVRAEYLGPNWRNWDQDLYRTEYGEIISITRGDPSRKVEILEQSGEQSTVEQRRAARRGARALDEDNNTK